VGPGVTIGRSGGSIGKVTFVGSDFWPHNTCLFVTDFKGNEPRFVAYLLGLVDLAQLNSGAAQPSLNRNFVYDVKVRFPDPPTQRAVAGVLSAYDDLIENNRRRMALLEEAARQLYREWFVRLRFPGHEHTRIVDGVPEGWKRSTLERLCAMPDGIQTGPFGSQLHQSDYTEDGVPVVMPKDLVGLRITLDSIARVPEELAATLARHRMAEGDTVYGRRGDIGRRAFIGRRQVGFLCGTGCLRIRPDPEAVNPRYLFDALGAPETAGAIANRAKGAIMPSLNASLLKSVPVLISVRRLQDLYAENVELWSQAHEVLEEQNLRLRAARDLLLPRLMSGEIAV
jgi:type I restriction enzyme S subunit